MNLLLCLIIILFIVLLFNQQKPQVKENFGCRLPNHYNRRGRRNDYNGVGQLFGSKHVVPQTNGFSGNQRLYRKNCGSSDPHATSSYHRSKLNCCKTVDDFKRTWRWKHQPFEPKRTKSENRMPRPFELDFKVSRKIDDTLGYADGNYQFPPMKHLPKATPVGKTYPDLLTKDAILATVYQGWGVSPPYPPLTPGRS
jgi:hypothetical protein